MDGKRRRARSCAALLLLAVWGAPAAGGERALRVASASDIAAVMPEIVSAFRRARGVRAGGERALRVASASDLAAVMPEIVSAFRSASGVRAEVVYGSSGNFVAQIEN